MALYEKELKELSGGSYYKGSFLAGGAVASVFSSKPINDYDLYFKNEESFKEAVESAYEDGFWCVSVSSRAITFSDHGTIYQFMHFNWFENVQQIFDSFDFTCCMGAVDNDLKELVLHERFLPDLASSKLIFNEGTAFPAASALRLLKFMSREFAISRRELAKIIVAIQFSPPKDWEELKEQLGGAYSDPVTMDSNSDFNLKNVIKSLDTAFLPADRGVGEDNNSSIDNQQEHFRKHLPANAEEALEMCKSFRK